MSAHTPASKSRPAAATATTPSSADAKTSLSSKVLGMKFMQRAGEGAIRQKLEKERTQVQNEQQWTAPSPPPAAIASSPYPASSAASASSSSSFLSPSPFPASVLPAHFSSVFAMDVEPPPSLLVSSTTGVVVPTAASSSNSGVAAVGHVPFVAGRRSFGAFNTTVDALVAQATAASKQSEKGERQERKEKKHSVSDDAMATHYVGLRGKGAQQKSSGGGNNKPKRTGGPSEDERPTKRQKLHGKPNSKPKHR